MTRGKITIDAAVLAELLQLPIEWEVQALFADPETGRLTLIVQGDFEPAHGQGVPTYTNVRYIQPCWYGKELDDGAPWCRIEWQPEQPPRKRKEKATDALPSSKSE